MKNLLEDLKGRHKRLAPAFIMIDPFGVKDFSMEVIEGLLANPKCELYITIMWSRMNRFRSMSFRRYMDDIFGPEWTSVNDTAPDKRRKELYQMYKKRLKAAGARYVLSFDLYKGKKIEYSIFFATQDLTGCDKMKQAIWKVCPFGDYSFQGETANQTILFGIANCDPLQSALLERFGSKGWTPMKEVLDFVKSDKTLYHSGQLRRPVLQPMEEKGLIQVEREGRKHRRGTYPDDCMIRFGDH